MFKAVALLGCLALAEGSFASEPRVREVEITVQKGYHPNRIQAAVGERLRLKITRREAGSCTKEIVFPTLNLRRELPTGELVVIDLPALAAGEVPFHCGMKMTKGLITVK